MAGKCGMLFITCALNTPNRKRVANKESEVNLPNTFAQHCLLAVKKSWRCLYLVLVFNQITEYIIWVQNSSIAVFNMMSPDKEVAFL